MTAALAIPGIDSVATPEGRARFEATATGMAREYHAATTAIREALETARQESDRIQAAFSAADSPHKSAWNHFDIEFRFDGRTVYRRRDGQDDYADMFREMRRKAWAMLVDHLGVKNVMSLKRRAEFDKQLKDGELPEITEETIISVVLGLVGEARNFAQEAAREVFDLLRPQRGDYKTNSRFRVGKRVILTYYIERGWGDEKFRPAYRRDAEYRAIEGAFLLLDGKGVVRDGQPALAAAIKSAGKDGKGETEYFRFRCFKNGNLHLEFKRLDLVKQLNGLAAGEYVLGEDAE